MRKVFIQTDELQDVSYEFEDELKKIFGED